MGQGDGSLLLAEAAQQRRRATLQLRTCSNQGIYGWPCEAEEPMTNKAPQRFTGRAGSASSGRLRRALDGAIDTERRYGQTLMVEDGRVEVQLGPSSGLMKTRQGLMLDKTQIGDKNREQLRRIADVSSSATLAELITCFNDLLSELRRTKNMRGGV